MSSVPRIHCPCISMVHTVCSRHTPQHTPPHTHTPPSRHEGMAVRPGPFSGRRPSSSSLGQVASTGVHQLAPQQALQRPAASCRLQAHPVSHSVSPREGDLPRRPGVPACQGRAPHRAEWHGGLWLSQALQPEDGPPRGGGEGQAPWRRSLT